MAYQLFTTMSTPFAATELSDVEYLIEKWFDDLNAKCWLNAIFGCLELDRRSVSLNNPESMFKYNAQRVIGRIFDILINSTSG